MVTVIVVNWNGRRLLPDCLGSLARQTRPPTEIMVVDNGSTDGSAAWLRQHHPEVTLLAQAKNLGFARANNLALPLVKTKYTALLNNDTLVHPGWLEHLTTALEADPRAGSAACKMLIYDQPGTIDRAGDGYTRAGAALMRGRGRPAKAFAQPEAILGACAGAALYRTAMLHQIGLFDDEFFLLYEDVDLALRAQLMGWSCLYVPQATIWHKVSASLVHDSATSVYYGHRNLEWAWLKNLPACLLWRSLPLHLLYDLVSLLFFVSRGRGRDFLKAKRDALRGLPRVLKQRRALQARRKAKPAALWRLFEPESFAERLARRRNPKG